jgi:large subunit ribosomal protein L18
MMKKTREASREIRHARIRKKVMGTAERPRLNVFKSHKNLYIQIIDDKAGHTLAAVSSLEPEVKTSLKARGNLASAKAIGTLVAQRAQAKGIKRVIFDRGGNRFFGAIKALADAARESGLEF